MHDDSFDWRTFPAVPTEFPGQQLDRLQAEVSDLKNEVALIESSTSVGYDPDVNLPASGGGSLYFNRLSNGTRELGQVQQERATELAYLLYESNPLGKAIVETTRDFVLGDSVTVTSGDPVAGRRTEQQEVMNLFWEDNLNLMDIKLQSKVNELGLYGEQCYPVEVNPVDGFVRLGYIDPAAIKTILVDPHNVERQLAVITYMRDPNTGLETDGKWYRIVSPEENANDPWYGRLKAVRGKTYGLPDELGQGGTEGSNASDAAYAPGTLQWYNSKGELQSHPVAGSCFYFTVNKVSNATRGRTDLLSLVDWVDAYDQLLFNEVDRGLLLKAFLWDVNLTGYSDVQIEAYKAANPQPKPGSVRYHNERVEWNAVTPDLKAADSSAAADLILSYVATGARLPKTWLNGTGDVNKATAQELGAPALARLSLRQKYVKYMIGLIETFVLDQAEMRGVIRKRPKVRGQLKPKGWSIHVNLPDLKQVNQIVVAQAINNVVVGLGLAVQQKMVDLNLAREVVVMFIEQMGVDVDLQELNESLGNEMPAMLMGDNGSAANVENPTGSGGANTTAKNSTTHARNMPVRKPKASGQRMVRESSADDPPDDVDKLLQQLNNLSVDPL